MTKQNLLAFLACAALLTALPACDSGGSDDDDNENNNQPNTYTATVTGYTSASMSGTATATGAAAFGGWGIVLGLGAVENITLVASNSDRPPTGMYEIIRGVLGTGEPNANQFAGSVVLGGGLESYTTTGGTLTLTTSTSTRVEGTFTLTADRFVGQGQIITVTGSFNSSNTGS